MSTDPVPVPLFNSSETSPLYRLPMEILLTMSLLLGQKDQRAVAQVSQRLRVAGLEALGRHVCDFRDVLRRLAPMSKVRKTEPGTCMFDDGPIVNPVLRLQGQADSRGTAGIREVRPHRCQTLHPKEHPSSRDGSVHTEEYRYPQTFLTLSARDRV